MNVLVTGGSGFIGTALSHRLLAAGHGVRILALRNTEAERANVEDLVERGAVFIEGSVGDPERRRDPATLRLARTREARVFEDLLALRRRIRQGHGPQLRGK